MCHSWRPPSHAFFGMSHSVACHEVGSSVVGCYSLTAAASNPDMVDMLPRVRGQGVMDLELSDGGCGTLVCLSPFLATPPVPVFLSFLSVLFFFVCFFTICPSLPLCLETVSSAGTQEQHSHEHLQ